MKTIDVLIKSVEKAKQKGYKCFFDFTYEKGKMIDNKTYYAIIFDKDFCKAIWGDEKVSLSLFNEKNTVFLWELHLKNMVVSNSPIDYLEKNL